MISCDEMPEFVLRVRRQPEQYRLGDCHGAF
jgi:hypothetical protein